MAIDNNTNEGIKGSIINGNDTITLKEGTYSESNNTGITINSGRNITIQGQNSNNKAVIY